MRGALLTFRPLRIARGKGTGGRTVLSRIASRAVAGLPGMASLHANSSLRLSRRHAGQVISAANTGNGGNLTVW